MDINTTLFREKFVIRNADKQNEDPLVATGNRIVLPLQGRDAESSETVVVRAQNMHLCLRMAAQILQTYQRAGPIFSRIPPFNFKSAWDHACSDHESTYNQDRWVSVYHNGKEVFTEGTHAAFLDVIEKCDARNQGNYDKALAFAEESFAKMGKLVQIGHESGIALVFHVTPEEGKCGLIHRGGAKNATFNFLALSKEDAKVSPVLCMNVCAAFLEGLQLSFQIGTANEQLRLGLIEKYSLEAKKAESAGHRLAELNIEIGSFTNRLKVRFRPEKPEFAEIITEAENFYRRKHSQDKK